MTANGNEERVTASTTTSPHAAAAMAPAATQTAQNVKARTAPLLWLVFLAGMGSMAVEMSASRLLAPFFGSSTIVWANIIGLVLASLSLGYWLGGRIADRRPRLRVLGLIVLAAAVIVAVVPFVARPLLGLSVRALDTVSAGAIIGSLLGSLLLFVPPVVLLGMVTPFAIRLSMPAVEDAGRTAGRIFALSTIGSLLGTSLPAIVFIPLVGTQRTLLGAAALIGLASAIVLGARWLIVGIVLAGLLAIPPGVVKATPGLVYEEESQYQFVQVAQHGDERYLFLNEGQAVHSKWVRGTVLTGGVWDTFLTLPAVLGRTPERVAILGSAGGTVARAYGEFYPSTRIDGVEIDGTVSEAGRLFFGLYDNPNVEVVTADARPFLRRTDRRYDVIMADAYHQPYVPFYLATREFFALTRERLRPGGIVALNVTTVPGDRRLVEAVAGTLATEYPQVVAWPALRFNTLVVGFSEPVPLPQLRQRLLAADGEVGLLTELFARDMVGISPIDDPWTDDRAPVEWITDRMIVAYGARGGTAGSEQLLPTAP